MVPNWSRCFVLKANGTHGRSGFSSYPLTVVRYQPVSQGLTTRPELSPPQRLAGAAASLLARPQSRVFTRESPCARVQVPPGSTVCRPSACGRQNSAGRLSPKANSHSFHEVPKKHLERRNNGCKPGVRHDFDPPLRRPSPYPALRGVGRPLGAVRPNMPGRRLALEFVAERGDGGVGARLGVGRGCVPGACERHGEILWRLSISYQMS